jgi:hypothetical protein
LSLFFSHFEFYITSFSCFLILLFEERGNVTRNTVTTTNDESQSKSVERRLWWSSLEEEEDGMCNMLFLNEINHSSISIANQHEERKVKRNACLFLLFGRGHLHASTDWTRDSSSVALRFLSSCAWFLFAVPHRCKKKKAKKKQLQQKPAFGGPKGFTFPILRYPPYLLSLLPPSFPALFYMIVFLCSPRFPSHVCLVASHVTYTTHACSFSSSPGGSKTLLVPPLSFDDAATHH